MSVSRRDAVRHELLRCEGGEKPEEESHYDNAWAQQAQRGDVVESMQPLSIARVPAGRVESQGPLARLLKWDDAAL